MTGFLDELKSLLDVLLLEESMILEHGVLQLQPQKLGGAQT